MRDVRVRSAAMLLCLLCATGAYAQSPSAAAASATGAVPNVIRFSGSFRPSSVTPTQPVESVTLSVYRDQTGGTALWQETQNVAVDGEGKYSVLMGSTQNDGVPMELLGAGEPRWLSVQFNRPGEAEQPRVLMASVPYALKSVDAETLGGKPASAYLLAPSGIGLASGGPSTGSAVSPSTTAPAASTTIGVNTSAVKPRTISGTQNFFPYFTDGSNDLGNSNMQQSGGYIGVGTVPGAGASTTPSLDLRTQPFSQIGMAQTTDYLTFFSSDTYGPAIYWNPGKDLRFGKGGTPLYNAFGFTEQMRIQSATGNVGIGTASPGSKLDVAGDINLSGGVREGGGLVLQSLSTNLAVGLSALHSNAGGFGNTATGYAALADNTGGNSNTASGDGALFSNTSGSYNTAVGYQTLENNISGSQNTAVGYQALQLSTATGGTTDNTALGYQALQNNTIGTHNIAIGAGAGSNVGSNSGLCSETACSYNIDIGNPGSSGDLGTIRIGDPNAPDQGPTYINGIFTESIFGGTPVVVNSNGALGVAGSSRRYKEDIQDMGDASRGLMDLRPVTFRYKKTAEDGSQPLQYGLIAEEVEEVYPDLVVHLKDGQTHTVEYQMLPAMLLNEVQKQNQHVQAQDETIRRQQEQVAQQQQQVLKQQEQIRNLEARLAALEGLLSGKVSATAGR